MGIQNLISKAQQTTPQILRAALAAMILFPGTSFGKQQYDDSVICENGRGGQMTRFANGLIHKATSTRLARGLIHNASYTADENGRVNIKPVPKDARKWFGTLLTVSNNEPTEVNGDFGVGNANGVMVSPCHMLTNHHVAFGDKPLPENDKSPEMKKKLASIYTLTLTNMKSQEGKPIVATPVEWGNRYDQGYFVEDWVLLELSECKGKETGWAELKESDEQIVNKKLAGVWYFKGEPAQTVRLNLPCAIDRIASNKRGGSTTCGSEGGSSGSGIYEQEPGQRPQLVALQVGSKRPDGEIVPVSEGGKNRVVTTNSFLPKISAIIEGSKQRFREELKAKGRIVNENFNPAFD